MENNEIKETKRGTRKPRAKRATAAEGDENAIFIGTLIQQELKNQERTVHGWLANWIATAPTCTTFSAVKTLTPSC